MNFSDIKSLIESEKIHTVQIGFADIQGVLRGKRISARHFLDNGGKGFALSKAVFVWDIRCEVFEGMDFANFDNGYPDMIAKPILSTFRKVPWQEGSAFVLCDLVDNHNEPIEVAPREILKRVIKMTKEKGYQLKIGSELEFYLLTGTKEKLYNGVECYSLAKGADLEFVLQDIRLSLEEIGILVEACNTEYGPGQVEVNLDYGDALDIADKTIIFKNAVKEIARKHSLMASFMAKIWNEDSGSGYHVHQSLWEKRGSQNLFEKDEKLINNYLGGLMTYMRELMIMGSPTINAFKRVVPYSFAPINVTWGYDNRTVAVRSILGEGKATRLEQRTGAADCNPYLAIAACIAAGLEGIERGIEPPPVVFGDAYAQDAPLLPTTLVEAADLFEQSVIKEKYFGSLFPSLFLKLARHELALYNTTVTDWEWKRYLELV